MCAFLLLASRGYAQVYSPAGASGKIQGTSHLAYKKNIDLTVYIKMKQGCEIDFPL